jgi:hypothetical protein
VNKSGSSLIDGLAEAEWALVQERSEQAHTDFQKSVRPIYASSVRSRRPEHIGSCLLLDVDGTRIISTAAHIMDNLRATTLFVCGLVGSRLVPILGGKVRATRPPGDDRHLDHLDCAFWRIPDSSIDALGKVEFLNASTFSHNRARTENRYYMATGFPVSRNKKAVDNRFGSISNRSSRYTGTVVELPKLAAEIKVSGAEHLFLQFGRHAFVADRSAANTFGPKGLSGGALLDLGDFTGPAIYAQDKRRSARLSGMIIEHYEDHQALVAVKIGLILEGIRRSLAGDRGTQA